MESKYYYINPVKDEYLSSRWFPEINKWNKAYVVDLRENVEWSPCISLSIVKYRSDSFPKPKSDKYQKVKPILEELFDDYYNHSLQNIYSAELCENEFYLIENSKSWYQIEYYSENEKDKRSLTIEFRDCIDDLWLRVEYNHSYKGRPNARKNGKPINKEDFFQFVNLTLKFLADHNSYQIYLDTYIKDFYNLASGNKKIEHFDLNADKAFKSILTTLEKRKIKIEKRLIENDEDSQGDRIKLRGELEGINYAIKTININK
ncbi:MAG: hypothetical protein MI922_06500 [Bacteroidales bacterium]|nr:hypothetical protein [Bacteroidales bacterium]